MPFFSVIIPLYNKEHHIKDTLTSILQQSLQDFEIIIVDDGSTDESTKVVTEFTDDRIALIKQKNQGVSVARNKGISIAKSNYIALLDADDTWQNNHLHELKKQIEAFPEAGLYCNNYRIYFDTNSFRPTVFNFTYRNDCLLVEDFFKASSVNSIAWTSAVGFSKEKFDQIGKFDTRLKTSQDLDLWIRFALKHDVSFNPVVTMNYNFYIDNSLSKKEYNVIRYDFLNKFSEAEKQNPSLKLYLDINRYALAIRSKINNEKEIYNKAKAEIDRSNLNSKQLLLLKLPISILKLMKRTQKFLAKKGMYLTAFK